VVHIFNRALSETPHWTIAGAAVAGQPSVRRANVCVTLEENDLVARTESGERLGSLIDTWAIASSTHQIELVGLGSHSPRLQVGDVVVQRESWLVEGSEDLLKAADPDRPAHEFFAFARRLRREMALPDEVFVRPLMPLRDSGHKDSKPLYLDFRSPQLVDLWRHTLRDFRACRISEALPSLGDFDLEDPSGHYSFELRLATVPRSGEAPP